ncbi:hypothetical protein llap_3312 [Limosa lapponica baueri]|uniref:Uncharacterized protein n=1 Tax=Limosa lapponica baueri TaxID=1758121 RepID=A0A2I0UK09_LIMLA|nr:hypothetical protein llap_3312 [Limosa lapponica baueri]
MSKHQGSVKPYQKLQLSEYPDGTTKRPMGYLGFGNNMCVGSERQLAYLYFYGMLVILGPSGKERQALRSKKSGCAGDLL